MPQYAAFIFERVTPGGVADIPPEIMQAHEELPTRMAEQGGRVVAGQDVQIARWDRLAAVGAGEAGVDGAATVAVSGQPVWAGLARKVLVTPVHQAFDWYGEFAARGGKLIFEPWRPLLVGHGWRGGGPSPALRSMLYILPGAGARRSFIMDVADGALMVHRGRITGGRWSSPEAGGPGQLHGR